MVSANEPRSVPISGPWARSRLLLQRCCLVEFLVLVVLHLVINVCFLRANQFPFSPWHPDDFSTLSFSSWSQLGVFWIRPVSTYLYVILSILGQDWFFAAVNVLMVLYPLLMFLFALELFRFERRWTTAYWATLVAFGVVIFSLSAMPRLARHLGLVTDLSSCTLGVAACMCVLRALSTSGGRSLCYSAAAIVLDLASGLAKEDFLHIPLALAGILILRNMRLRQSWRPKLTELGLLMALAISVAGVFLYNRHFQNPHTNGGRHYTIDLSPGSLWTTFLTSHRLLDDAKLIERLSVAAAVAVMLLWRKSALPMLVLIAT